MPAEPDAPLSSNQKSMLDLAATPKPAPLPPLSSAASSYAVIALVLVMVAAGFLPPCWNLVFITLSMVLVLVVISRAVTTQALGVWINERNLMSLSRFQMAVWTIVVLAGYFTYALMRIRAGNIAAPLDIAIDWHLWALLGISTTSLVGSPLVLNTKKEKNPTASSIKKTAALTREPEEDVATNHQGTLYANTSPEDARFTDIFEGDEVGNTTHVDLSKVQMFYFTVIAAAAYFVMLFEAVRSGGPLTNQATLPVLPDGLVAVLGISHAGYLTNKGISHTQTQDITK